MQTDGEVTMKKKIILIYEYFYEYFIRDSIAPDVEIVKEYNIRGIEDIENIESKPIVESGGDVCIGYAIYNRKMKLKFVTFLLSCGIDRSRILDIYKSYMAGYSKNRFQRVMNCKLNQKLDGLVLGISHGQAGIAEDRLPGNVCNLCYGSQDIYFNYLTLKKCYEQYYHEIKDIKYAVIDMFDYFYFNFDTILSGAFDIFFEASGFLCEERTPWSREQSVQEINEMLKDIWKEGKNRSEQNLFSEFFPYAREGDNGVSTDHTYYDAELADSEITKYKNHPVIPAVQTKIFRHTIQFQTDHMVKLLLLLKEIQPEIRIFMVLLPKYKIVEDAEKIYNQTWKTFFMNMIGELKKDFSLELLDFKDYEEISAYKENYRDLSHLGFDGAIRFTEHLSDLLLHQYGLDSLF